MFEKQNFSYRKMLLFLKLFVCCLELLLNNELKQVINHYCFPTVQKDLILQLFFAYSLVI